MERTLCSSPPVGIPSGFAGLRLPPEVIVLAMRW
jgi:hypothetical protein